jgi:ADP-ribose pyrophosphatase YjhB (NUDIX family)
MDARDCAFQGGEGRFRYRAGAIILEDGCVLMVKNEVEPYFYSVGGAVKLGETAGEAAVREALEETGVNYEIDRLQYVHENFFFSEGTPCHEISLYFLMKPKGVKTFATAAPTVFGVERMAWIPIADYKNHRAYPEFFGEKLADMKPFVEHIVTRI